MEYKALVILAGDPLLGDPLLGFLATSYLKQWTNILVDSWPIPIQATNQEHIGWYFTSPQKRKENFLTVMDKHQIFIGINLETS